MMKCSNLRHRYQFRTPVPLCQGFWVQVNIKFDWNNNCKIASNFVPNASGTLLPELTKAKEYAVQYL